MKLNYTSKYMVVKSNYLFLNDFYTHRKWIKFNISVLSKGEKKKLTMGLMNKSIRTKIWTVCLVNAKHEHP